MDLYKIENTDTKEVINLASHSSAPSPSMIITSSSPKGFMNQKPTSKKHIGTVVSKIRENNKELITPNVQLLQIEQSGNETD